MQKQLGSPVSIEAVTRCNNNAVVEKAYRLINDDVPTIALYTDPNEEIFQNRI